MLYSLRVENYMSLKEEQTLSFERNSKPRIYLTDGPACGDYSPIEVIFGANASGKSNALSALGFMTHLIKDSAGFAVNHKLPNVAFALDPEYVDAPSTFSAHFLSEKHREYEYSFTIWNGKIIKERLDEKVVNRSAQNPKRERKTTRNLFMRDINGVGKSKGDTQIFVSSRLHGSKMRIIEATRDNMLFLSKAATDDFEPLMDAYNWFLPFDNDENSTRLFERDADFRNWVTALLESSNLGITNVQVEHDGLTSQALNLISETKKQNTEAAKQLEAQLFRDSAQPRLTHRGSGKSAEIAWNQESAGTRQLWNYAANLYFILKAGEVGIIDEFEGLHPLLLRKIISMFQSKETNPNGAQLLFTSHDIVLLGNFGGMGYALNRDQIWFTEKDDGGATELYSLADFKSREGENAEKMYLQGRLGATPLL